MATPVYKLFCAKLSDHCTCGILQDYLKEKRLECTQAVMDDARYTAILEQQY